MKKLMTVFDFLDTVMKTIMSGLSEGIIPGISIIYYSPIYLDSCWCFLKIESIYCCKREDEAGNFTIWNFTLWNFTIKTFKNCLAKYFLISASNNDAVVWIVTWFLLKDYMEQKSIQLPRVDWSLKFCQTWLM